MKILCKIRKIKKRDKNRKRMINDKDNYLQMIEYFTNKFMEFFIALVCAKCAK